MLSSTIDTQILPAVQRPSRYLGTELNSVHKDLAEVDTRICLCYPDLYDLALGNLGLLVLYAILNQQSGVWAERAYAPAPDLEEVLRNRELPLFSVESRTPLSQFDMLGFTLQYELTYTNLLNMLELGGVPLLTADRDDSHPLVVAGGPGALNPEPLADFVDAFAVGDGEEVVLDLVAAVRETRGLPRDQRLTRLAEIPGVYVPALGAARVVRRVVEDFETALIPTAYLVPFTQQVHDRISLEVLRGCTHGCRFCQAGMVSRPVRERSAETVEAALREALTNTGYEGLALTSLNTCDHTQAGALLARAIQAARDHGADVSLPSLRLDAFSLDLADMVRSIRRTGLTFAPEAATDRLRAVINKSIPDDELIGTTRAVFARGWDLVKLYFMIGLPTEREEDVEAIADLTNRVLSEGRRASNRARVNLGVATFVPKPHTPFQWVRQIGIEETLEKQALLRRRLKKGLIKFGRHDAEASFLEGVFSRADRSAGKVLLAAFKQGCRFDGWSEYFDFARWQRAFEETGFDAEAQLAARPLDAALPWDHVDVLVDKDWLRQEAQRADDAEPTPDCRAGKCHQCGVMEHVPTGCQRMLGVHREGRRVESPVLPPAMEGPARGTQGQQGPQGLQRHPVPVSRSPAQWKLRFRLSKTDRLRWLSHLELQSTLLRALRRARVPLAYSQGFHPHPRLSFASAIGVGVASEAEYADVVLSESLSPRDFVRSVNGTLPTGLRVTAACGVSMRQPALMAQTRAETYEAFLTSPPTALAAAVSSAMEADALVVERWHKKGLRQVDVRPMIAELEAVTDDRVRFTLVPHEDNAAKPSEVLAALGVEGEALITKTDTQVRARGQWVSPLDELALGGDR
jgi:radical SAM family uncharacterized protein/radical SAM-linked protein